MYIQFSTSKFFLVAFKNGLSYLNMYSVSMKIFTWIWQLYGRCCGSYEVMVTGIDYFQHSASAKMWLKLGMSSGGQNFTVLSILLSKVTYYELNATIILDWWSNMHPWKTILCLSSSPLIFLLNLLAWAQWTIRYLEHKGFIANISQNFYS